jgi:hypothetical protein
MGIHMGHFFYKIFPENFIFIQKYKNHPKQKIWLIQKVLRFLVAVKQPKESECNTNETFLVLFVLHLSLLSFCSAKFPSFNWWLILWILVYFVLLACLVFFFVLLFLFVSLLVLCYFIFVFRLLVFILILIFYNFSSVFVSLVLF